MTDTPVCPKCGAQMKNNIIPDLGNEHERLGDYLCPLDPKDCRIAALERELAEAKANALIEEEQLLAVLPEDFGAVEYIKALEKQVAELEAEIEARGPVAVTKRVTPEGERIVELERELVAAKGTMNEMLRCYNRGWYKRISAERDEARSQLCKAQEQVVALNKVLSVVKEELDKDHECPGCHLPLIAHHGLLERALARTSATAQEIVQRVEQEAVERLAVKAEKQPYDNWPLCNAAGDQYSASELREAFAAILGEGAR